MTSGLFSSTSDPTPGLFHVQPLASEVPVLVGIELEEHEESNAGVLRGQVWSDAPQFH